MTKKKKTMEGGGGSEFFICFTSRLSSSSTTNCSSAMRVPSSKTLMSPGRNRDPSAPSLSASLSRRLRSSGSVKGGQSPMFPAAGVAVGSGGRKKGCAFEAAEPSSPKVTCIGQVRVKSKKKKSTKAVLRSRSHRGGGEASFRRTATEMGEGGEKACLPNRNQKWVHQLPLSICEALRAFGSEFNCFLPCGGGRSTCSPSSSSASRGEGEKRDRGERRSRSTSSSCGAVFARWLMAIQESEEGKGREVVGLVVEERMKGEVGSLVREREEDRGGELEVEELGGNRGGVEKKEAEVAVAEKVEEDEGRVSVCIPPRNALLLMRCRSDPVRMAELASRFLGSPAAKVQCEKDEDDDDEKEEKVGIEEREKDHQKHVEDEKEEEKEEEESGEEVHVDAEQVYLEIGELEEEVDNAIPEGVILDVALEEEKVNQTEENESAEEVEKQLQGPNEEKPDRPEDEEGILGEVSSAKSVCVHTNPPKVGEEADETMFPEEPEKEELKDEIRSRGRKEEEEEEERGIKGRRSINCSSSKSNDLSKAKDGGKRPSCSSNKERRRHSFSTEREARRHSFSSEREARRASFSADREGRRWSFSIDVGPKQKPMVGSAEAAVQGERKKEEVSAKEEAMETIEPKTTEAAPVMAEDKKVRQEVEEREERKGEGEGGEKKRRELPDCLLLMMYEPKLSMEVSKETWVCSTDFLRWRPHNSHHPLPPSKGKAKEESGDDKSCENKEVIAVAATDSTVQHPPPRPPLPAPPTVLAIEQKLLSSAVGQLPPPAAPPYEPFVLKRCKSEPMKSSARLSPDTCFWKSRHRPIGAAGIGV